MPPAKTGETIQMVQSAAEHLFARLREDPAYGGARYEHAPCYRLVLAFTDGQPRRWVIEAADPQLRPYIAFSRSRFSEGERNTAAKLIRETLGAAGIGHSFFDGGAREEWDIYMGSQAELERARALVPERYLPIIRFHIGIPYSTPERG